MVNEIWLSAAAGAVAGLGVAMPLGAIAALLLREGLVNGFRVAAAAAAGVATADLLYCAMATATGALFARTIQDHRGAFLTASGVLIVAIGALQLRRGLKERTGGDPQVERIPAGLAYLRFVALTGLNPMTLIYFIALGGAVDSRGSSWVGPVVFVASVGLTSLAWQLLLAMTGSVFGRAAGPGLMRIIGGVASLLIIALGGIVLVSGMEALGSFS
ncbi:LysE family transporter [Arthrobacter silvisoli]|uniref:LysE family transporter n=1 Tax=Arthrobacter silvisoli TaxID=2291022 RepID=UPI000E2163DE|nr:LysE family transporter [Arthrobacter silvisoli]